MAPILSFHILLFYLHISDPLAHLFFIRNFYRAAGRYTAFASFDPKRSGGDNNIISVLYGTGYIGYGVVACHFAQADFDFKV
jgi:hypothetical protein